MDNKKMEQDILDLMSYMITSARGLMDEPGTYGPFRLIDGVSRLCTILKEAGHPDSEFLSAMQEDIDTDKFTVMTDLGQFRAMLDKSVLDMTHHLMEKVE